jgi:hypothetical protein
MNKSFVLTADDLDQCPNHERKMVNVVRWGHEDMVKMENDCQWVMSHDLLSGDATSCLGSSGTHVTEI